MTSKDPVSRDVSEKGTWEQRHEQQGLFWIDLWAEGISTLDPKLGMSLASLESKEACSIVSKRVCGAK